MRVLSKAGGGTQTIAIGLQQKSGWVSVERDSSKAGVSQTHVLGRCPGHLTRVRESQVRDVVQTSEESMMIHGK